MRKRIVSISASPRRGGNSDLLCDAFLQGAEEVGHQVEKIRLSEKKIAYCTGCCSCIRKPGACIQHDDMNDLLALLLQADVFVLASPIYFHSFNAQMKTFIDRFCPIYPQVHNKDVYLLLAAAGGNSPVNNTLQSFRAFLECLDVTEQGVVAATGIWDVGKVKGTKALEQAYAMGKKA